MSYKSKYLGILKGYDFGSLLFDDNNITILLEKKVIISIYEEDESKAQANWIIPYKGNSYILNYAFLNDIYETIKSYVESLSNDTILWFLDNIKIEYNFLDIQNSIETTLNLHEKILILEDIYKEINTNCLDFNLNLIDETSDDCKYKIKLSSSDDFPIRRLYFEFLEKNNEAAINWKEWVHERISVNSVLINYLTFDNVVFDRDEILYEKLKDKTKTSIIDTLLPNFKKLLQDTPICFEDAKYDLVLIWSNFITLKKINDFISSKIEELENNIFPNTQKKGNYSAMEIAYYAYYMKEAKDNFLKATFPSESGYKELSEKFGPNWKNIQKEYLSIYNDSDIRLKESRAVKIEKIQGLLSPKALSISEYEYLMI